jgi:putative tricarboxylic transport membrane protein
MTVERGGSLFFLAIGIYVLVQSFRLPMGSWTQPGPGVFPFILSLLLTLVGIALLVSSSAGKRVNWGDILAGQVTPWSIIALTAFFILGFERVGFVPASGIYIFVLLYAVSRLPFARAAGLSAAITAAGWVLFVKILNLQLPAGLWRF